jgi:aldehyde dehydrogenase (NAD+)
MTVDSMAQEQGADAFTVTAQVRTLVAGLKGCLIGGAWRQGGGQTYSHVYSANQTIITPVALAGPADVSDAIAAARQALPAWRKSDPEFRARVMHRLAELIEQNGENLARLQTFETGFPISGSRMLIPTMASWTRYYAGFCDKIEGGSISQLPEGRYFMTREPYGVVAIMLTWNMPMSSVCMKAMAALAAGNTVVIKSPEMAPFAMMLMADLFDQAGFPAGVVNVMPAGPEGGEALSSDPRVGKISFTGGAVTAAKVLGAAAPNITPTLFELGGKSACMIFDDADLDAAIPFATCFAYAASGQACILPTRMLVHEAIYDQTVAKVTALAKGMTLGDPFDDTTQYGPVISEAASQRIVDAIARNQASNAGRIVVGGSRPAESQFAKGAFVEPTLFVDVDPGSDLFVNELFGPVLAVSRFRDEADAIAQANGTRFGLFSYLFTRDIGRAMRIADAMEAGSISINSFVGLLPKAPFGGFGISGYGKEGGRDGLLEFTRTKTIFIGD